MNFLLQLFIYVVLAVASSILQSSQAQQEKNAPGVRGSRQVGGNNSLAFVVGKTGVAGQFEYGGDWGEDGGTPNALHSEVYSLGDLPYNGFPGLSYNGTAGTLLYGEPHAELGIPVLEARIDGKDHLWAKFYDGTQTIPDAMMVARFGGLEERPYTADMIFRGVPYVVVTSLVNRELFTGFPSYVFTAEGISLYDVRLDSTAGGTGAQRWSDPSTWTYSDNPIVVAYNILMGIRYEGEWLYGGQKTTQYQLPFSWWATAADKCDALRDGTSERRFRCGYEIVCAEIEPQAAIGEMLLSCAGRITEIGGQYKVVVGDPGEPVKSFTDADIIITDDQELDPFPGLEVTCNVISSTYPERAEAYGMKEAPTRYSSALEEADDGRRLPKSITYNAVPHALQVQDLDRIAVEDARRFRIHINTMPPEWWELEPLDVEAWTSARGGYVSKRFLITAMDDLPNGNQLVARREIEPADYSWSSDYALPWDVAPLGITRPAPQPVAGAFVEPIVIEDGLGRGRRPGIGSHWNGDMPDLAAVRITIRLASTEAVVWEGEAPRPLEGYAPLGQNLVNDTGYEVQMEYRPFSGRATTPTSWLPVTTPDVRLSVYDLDDEIGNLVGMLEGTGSLIERIDGVRQSLAELAATATADATTSYVDRQQITRSLGSAKAEFLRQTTIIVNDVKSLVSDVVLLTAEFNGNVSFVGQQLEALSTADSANAFAISEVAVEVDGVSAGALFKMQVSVAPAGWDVSLAEVLRVDTGATFYEAGRYTFIKSSGETGTAFKGNAFYLLSDVGGIVSSPFSVVGGVTRMQDVEVYGDIIVFGEILTEHGANYAFSRQEVYRAAGAITVSNGLGEVEIASLTATNGTNTGSRSKIQMKANLRAIFDGTNNWGTFEARLRRDGSLVSSVRARPDDEGQEGLAVDFELDTSADGASRTWTVGVEYVTGPGPGASIEAYGRFLSVERADK